MAGTVSGELIGRVIGGRFRLEALLGIGAAAEVYLAVDTRLRRRVAVKVLHRSVATDQQFVRRFRSEAQLAARLTHPNIMVIHDWHDGISQTDTGTAEPAHLITEYLDGGSLREILDRHGRLTISQTTLVGIEAARALAYAHSQGIVHRDIKPANLLFAADGSLRIGDFGIARALAEAAHTEPTGGLVGTARYAAPEQISGESLDGRADVYSLMLVLIEAATGEAPFRADTPLGVLMGRQQNPVVPPAELGPLADAIAPAGTVRPDTRIDAQKLVRRLERATRDLPRPDRIPVVVSRPLRSLSEVDLTQHEPSVVLAGSPSVADETLFGGPLFDLSTDDSAASPPTPAEEQGVAPGFASDLAPDKESVHVVPVQGLTPPVSSSPSSVDRKPRRWGRALAALLVITLAGGALGGWRWWSTRTRYANVPELVKLSERDALERIESTKLVANVTRVEDENVPRGMVISQTPATAERVEQETPVSIVISLGPRPRTVPNVVGSTLDQATASLESIGLRAGLVTEQFDESVNNGLVVSFEPTGSVPRDTSIDLVVSKGPKPVVVPNFSGMTPEQAKDALPDGLTAVIVKEPSESVAAGIVIAANYKPGSELPRGSQIKIRVSTGPPKVVVPRTRGLTVDDAIRVLRRAGLEVSGVDGPPDELVRGTQPADGTEVERNTEVRLRTARPAPDTTVAEGSTRTGSPSTTRRTRPTTTKR